MSHNVWTLQSCYYLLLFSPPLGQNLSSFLQYYFNLPPHLCVINCTTFVGGRQWMRTEVEKIHSGNKWSEESKLETLTVGVDEQSHLFGADFGWTSYLCVRVESQDDSSANHHPTCHKHVIILMYPESESLPLVGVSFPFSVSQIVRLRLLTNNEKKSIQMKKKKKKGFLTANIFGVWWY